MVKNFALRFVAATQCAFFSIRKIGVKRTQAGHAYYFMLEYQLWIETVYRPYLKERFQSRRWLDFRPDCSALDCLIADIRALLSNTRALLGSLTSGRSSQQRNCVESCCSCSGGSGSNNSSGNNARDYNILPLVRQIGSLYYASRASCSFLHWCVELKYSLAQQLDYCIRKRIEDFVSTVPIGGSDPRCYDIEPICQYACEHQLYEMTAEQIYESFVHYQLDRAEK